MHTMIDPRALERSLEVVDHIAGDNEQVREHLATVVKVEGNYVHGMGDARADVDVTLQAWLGLDGRSKRGMTVEEERAFRSGLAMGIVVASEVAVLEPKDMPETWRPDEAYASSALVQVGPAPLPPVPPKLAPRSRGK